MDRDISNEEEKQPVYCFYDDENMQKSNVMDALNKAVRFCSAYQNKRNPTRFKSKYLDLMIDGERSNLTIMCEIEVGIIEIQMQ